MKKEKQTAPNVVSETLRDMNFEYEICQNSLFRQMSKEEQDILEKHGHDDASLEIAWQQIYPKLEDCILEMTDNSIDAQAKEIVIDFDYENNRLFISDNGSGMDPKTMYENFFKIRSKKAEDRKENENGCYGIGATGALCSIGYRTDVITKSYHDELGQHYFVAGRNYSGQTLSHHPVSKIQIEGRPLYDDFKSRFDKINKDYETGTIIAIQDIKPKFKQHFSAKKVIKLREMLHTKIGQTYSKYIKNNKVRFIVMKEEVKPVEIVGKSLPQFDFTISMPKPSNPNLIATFKISFHEALPKAEYNKFITRRMDRLVGGGFNFGQTTIKNQLEAKKFAILVESNNSAGDEILNIRPNKTMSDFNFSGTDFGKKLFDHPNMQKFLEYFQKVTQNKTLTQTASELCNLEEWARDIVRNHQDNLSKTGGQIIRPIPNKIGGHPSSGNKVKPGVKYKSKTESFDLNLRFEEFLNDDRTKVKFSPNYGYYVGNRHNIDMTINLNESMNKAIYSNKSGNVSGIRKLRAQELFNDFCPWNRQKK